MFQGKTRKHYFVYVRRIIFKDPITDNGIKKSARGLLAVRNGELHDEQVSLDVESDLKPVFNNGRLLVNQSLGEIRKRVDSYK